LSATSAIEEEKLMPNNKTPKGGGSFRDMPNGMREYTINIGSDIYGNRRRKSFYGKTDSECLKKYKLFQKEGEQKPAKSKAPTVSAWADRWLEIYKKGDVEDSTYEDYRYMVGYIKKHSIAKMRLPDVQPVHVKGFFKSINDYSHSVQKKVRFILSAIFEAAIDNEYCNRNPVRNVKLGKSNQTEEKEAFTEDEVKTILEFAKTDRWFGLPITIMLNSGIRSGEMRALSPTQIDLKTGVITVDRAVKHTEVLGKPKNNKTRYVPLEPDVAEFLAERIDRSAKYLVGNTHYVTRAGFRSRYLHFFNRLNKHLASQGLEAIDMKSPHATRHTYSTLRQKHGMPVAMVSALLGHSSTDVTDKYTHLKDVDTLSEAVRKYGFTKPTNVNPNGLQNEF
jgi:integrase